VFRTTQRPFIRCNFFHEMRGGPGPDRVYGGPGQVPSFRALLLLGRSACVTHSPTDPMM